MRRRNWNSKKRKEEKELTELSLVYTLTGNVRSLQWSLYGGVIDCGLIKEHVASGVVSVRMIGWEIFLTSQSHHQHLQQGFRSHSLTQ